MADSEKGQGNRIFLEFKMATPFSFRSLFCGLLIWKYHVIISILVLGGIISVLVWEIRSADLGRLFRDSESLVTVYDDIGVSCG